MTQTFIISSSFEETAKCLDSRRLNKQITEAYQVYRFLMGEGKMQGNPHPYRMWKGSEFSLLLYIHALHKEWTRRFEEKERGGTPYHKNGLEAELEIYERKFGNSNMNPPRWIMNEEILSSYRSALLYKDYNWYSQFGWKEKPAIPLKINKNGSVSLPYLYGENK
jgi:hypothetical protein